jgi:hypothetical protein
MTRIVQNLWLIPALPMLAAQENVARPDKYDYTFAV